MILNSRLPKILDKIAEVGTDASIWLLHAELADDLRTLCGVRCSRSRRGDASISTEELFNASTLEMFSELTKSQLRSWVDHDPIDAEHFTHSLITRVVNRVHKRFTREFRFVIVDDIDSYSWKASTQVSPPGKPLGERVYDALNHLPSVERRVLESRYIEGESLKSISKAEGVTPTTVCKRLKSATQRLKAILDAP